MADHALQIKYSTTRSVRDTALVTRREQIWATFCDEMADEPPIAEEKEQLPLLKFVTFGDARNKNGSLRHNANVLEVYGLVGDYDAECVTIEQAVLLLDKAGIEAFICSTPSHMAETFDKKTGKQRSFGGPRWRVVAPLSRVHNPREHGALIDRLNGALGGILAVESWTLSQVFYFGQVTGVPYETRHVRGRLVDQADDILPIGKGGSKAPERHQAAPANDDLFPEMEGPASAPAQAQRADKLQCVSESKMREIEAAAMRVAQRRGVDSYPDWVINIGMPLASLKGTEHEESARLLWHEVSALSSKYDDDECERKWAELTPNEVTYETLLMLARDVERPEDYLDDFDILPEPDPAVVKAERDARIAAKVERFHVHTVEEMLRQPPPKWIVRGVVPDADLGVIYGASGASKTFAALDLMAAIDQGTPWRGNETRKLRVVFIVAEGSGGFRNRLAAYQQHHEVKLGIGAITQAPNLLDLDDVAALAEAIEASGGAGIIVIDTLAQTTPGADENSGKDMGRALAHCKRLRELTGAMVLLVHHSGKDAAKGQRGWSGLKAACDFELEVTRNGDHRQLEVTKLKDGAGEGGKYAFKLQSVQLGLDDDGGVIDSCVCVPTDAPIAKREPKGDNQKIVLRLAHDLADLGDGTVHYGELKQNAFEHMPPAPDKKGYDRRVEKFQAAVQGLVAGGFMSILNGVVTLL